MTMLQKSHDKTRKLVSAGMLSAISIILGMTPLGIIPIGPLSATTMHLPVIIGAVLEGPVVGLIIGAIFGGFSLYQAASGGSVLAPLFMNPLVSILPRLLIVRLFCVPRRSKADEKARAFGRLRGGGRHADQYRGRDGLYLYSLCAAVCGRDGAGSCDRWRCDSFSLGAQRHSGMRGGSDCDGGRDRRRLAYARQGQGRKIIPERNESSA